MKLMKQLLVLLAKGAAFYAASGAGVLLAMLVINGLPWLYAYDDMIIGFAVTIAMGVLYYFIGKYRRLTLMFAGLVSVVYTTMIVNALCQIRGMSTKVAHLRCALGIVDIIMFLMGFGILFGERLGIMPASKKKAGK